MASSGVFELTAYTDLAAADVFAAVDVSDSTQSPQGSLKKITAASAFAAAQPITIASGTVTVSTPVFQATQTWNAGGVTFTGIDLNITSSASASGSLLANLRVGGSSMWKVDKSGNVTAAGTLTSGAINGQTISSAASFTGSVTVGSGFTVSAGTSAVQALTATTGALAPSITGASGLAYGLQVVSTINQSGTAGYAVLWADESTNTQGSGVHLLFRGSTGAGTTTQFSVDIAGNVFANGALALNGATVPDHGIAFASGVPSALADGQLWYDSAAGAFKVRLAGATKTVTVA